MSLSALLFSMEISVSKRNKHCDVTRRNDSDAAIMTAADQTDRLNG